MAYKVHYKNSMKTILFTVILLFCFAISEAKMRIILIGISDYQDSRIEDLEYTLNDIHYFKKIFTLLYPELSSKDFVSLTNEEATYQNIRQAILNTAISDLTENDTLILYMNGHGLKKKLNQSFYQLYTLANSSLDDNSSFLFEEELYLWSMMMKAKTKIFIFDTCSPMNFSFENWKNDKKGLIIFSATTENYSALESPAMKHSFFTYIFCKGLKSGADKNHDNQIDFFELKSYTQNNIELYTNQFISQPYLNGDPELLSSFSFPNRDLSQKGIVIYVSPQYSLVDLGELEIENQHIVLSKEDSHMSYPINQIFPLYSKIQSSREIVKGDILCPKKASYSGSLIIDAEPWAIIEINNKAYGFSPIRIKDLESKEYTVKLTHPDLGSKKEIVLIEPGKTTKLKVNMNEKK